MKLEINDENITHATGVRGVVGPDEVLLDNDDNLIAGRPWAEAGYTVEAFLDASEWQALRDGIVERVHATMRSIGSDAGDFPLERYHHHGGSDEAAHAELARHAGRGFPTSSLPIDSKILENRIGEICGVPLTTVEPGTDDDVFNLRIVRPKSNDNNPLHRDVWLDHLRNAVNIYVPIAGSTDLSSLALVPGSHRWKESELERTPEGATVNSRRFSVPSIVGATRRLQVVRPDPGPNQVLVFSPYLIHGGATNLNPDATRVSLEMRFWRAPA